MIDSHVYTQRIDMKSYGTMEGVYINGAPQGITFHETDNFTLYPASIISINPSLTPIIVESCYYYTFSVLAMDSVSYKFLFF